MKNQAWDSNSARAEIGRLIVPGVLGFYRHFEVTEVVGFTEDQASAVNVFTILVAEDRFGEVPQTAAFLNTKPICLKSIKGWSFGIMRYTRPIAELIPALEGLDITGQWRQSGKPLTVGKLISLPPTFVPPDSATSVPWNHVLKNNFWNGSYLFEWSDPDKRILQPFFDHPPRLQELSEALQKFVPLGLASLSDRLGNFVLQLPSTVIMSSFGGHQNGHDFVINVAWHPKASPRSLLASLRLEFDGLITGYTSALIQTGQTVLPMPAQWGLHHGTIWDEQHQNVLAATGPSSFINSIDLNMEVISPEPRIFGVKQADDSIKEYRVGLVHLTKSIIGQSQSNGTVGWTQRRMYREELIRLVKERRFVQYKPLPGQEQREHEKALQDLRALINEYGSEGSWLWDPFLSAHDILETLFHCKYANVDLRALSGADDVNGSQVPRASFAERQRTVFKTAQNNMKGLRLEYRVKTGTAGWNFHDRFLIFPKTDSGALAWSLGSSINSLGKRHHILQRVDDGQLVKDAFIELWDQLDKPEHLVWKNP